MKTLLQPKTDATVLSLLQQIQKRDQQIATLQERLEQSYSHIKVLEEILKSSHLSIAKPPAQPIRLQIFWLAAEAFTEAHSRTEEIPVDGIMRDYLIELPANLGGILRIDPGSGPAFWDFEYFGLHPINGEQTIAPRPAAVCAAATDFAGITINDGALLLPLYEGIFSLFATSLDPQILWKLPSGLPDVPIALKIRCRTRNCADGYLQSMLLGLGKIYDANARHLREEITQIRRELLLLPGKMERPAAIIPRSPSLLRRLIRRLLG